MPYSVTKQLDGDNSIGNLRGEFVVLQPAANDYATGGYLLQGIGGSTEGSGNVGIDRIKAVLPFGGQGGYVPVWNPTTSKLQVFQQSAATGALTEVPAATNLSAVAFNLWVIGY